MLRVLRVLQIQANRLWTWLEGEAEESEEEEEGEEEEEAADDGDEEEEEEEEEADDDVPLTPHGKKQARGTVKREHSEDEPDDVPEKHSSSAAKASGGQTSRRSRSAEASPGDGRLGGQRRTQGARRRRCRRRCRTRGGLSRGRWWFGE